MCVHLFVQPLYVFITVMYIYMLHVMLRVFSCPVLVSTCNKEKNKASFDLFLTPNCVVSLHHAA